MVTRCIASLTSISDRRNVANVHRQRTDWGTTMTDYRAAEAALDAAQGGICNTYTQASLATEQVDKLSELLRGSNDAADAATHIRAALRHLRDASRAVASAAYTTPAEEEN